jgi:predicted DCC family thiol-disulfide oxidoreductase YuxK
LLGPSREAYPAVVVLYDGTCGLCDRTVRFLLARDERGRFRFAPLQGAFAIKTLARHGEDAARLDSFRVVVDSGTPRERVRSRADAALFLAARLPFPWPLWAGLRVLPRPWLDAAYAAVARSRYRRFGRTDACRPPPPEHRARFVSDGGPAHPTAPGTP